MATRLRRSFIAKMSSMLLILKSFFWLSVQRIPQARLGARTKHGSEGTSGGIVQVSVLGRVQPSGLGKIGKLLRVRVVYTVIHTVIWVGVLGLGQASAQELQVNDAMDVYRTIDGWVRDRAVPGAGVQDRNEQTGDEQPGDELPLLSVASVTLRLDGQVIGRGQVSNPDADDRVVVLATRAAIADASAWVRGMLDQEPTDEQWAGIFSRMTLSVEVAARSVPMGITALGEPSLGLSPGVHGLIMRLGERSSLMTPDEMISAGFGPERGAYAMATELSNDGGMALASIGELVSRGYSFARFEPIWIAQTSEGQGGVFIDRGGRVIEERSVGVKSVRAMADHLAGYLIAQRWPGSESFGMVGTRDVVSGRATPEVAPVYEQALVATALLRFAQSRDGEQSDQAREAALQLLIDLSVVDPGEPKPWEDGIGSAACVIAYSYFEPMDVRTGLILPEENPLQRLCTEALDELFSPIDGFAAHIPPAAHGLIAWAMVRSGHEHGERAVRTVFRDTDAGQLAGQMPFLGWAELGLAEGKEEVAAAGALNQMRAWMWEHQLGKSDLEWRDRDYIGSIVFTKGARSLPGSGNVRPMAFVCSMLGDPRLTPGTIADIGVASEIGRVASAMRFMNQLVMDEQSAFLSRAPDQSVGGLRSSLMDWSVSPASSAVALMAALEFEESMRKIGARKPSVPSP